MHQDGLQQKSIARSAALEVLTYRMAERQAHGSEENNFKSMAGFAVSMWLTSVSLAQLPGASSSDIHTGYTTLNLWA